MPNKEDPEWIEEWSLTEFREKVQKLKKNRIKSIEILHSIYRQFYHWKKKEGFEYETFGELCNDIFDVQEATVYTWIQHMFFVKILSNWLPEHIEDIVNTKLIPLLEVAKGIPNIMRKILESDSDKLIQLWNKESQSDGDEDSKIFGGCYRNCDGSRYLKERTIWAFKSAVKIARLNRKAYPEKKHFRLVFDYLKDNAEAYKDENKQDQEFWKNVTEGNGKIIELPSNSEFYQESTTNSIQELAQQDPTQPNFPLQNIEVNTDQTNVATDESVIITPEPRRNPKRGRTPTTKSPPPTQNKISKNRIPITEIVNSVPEEESDSSSEEDNNLWKKKYQKLKDEYDDFKNDSLNEIRELKLEVTRKDLEIKELKTKVAEYEVATYLGN